MLVTGGGEAVPYTRLTNEEKTQVIEELTNQLYTTGKRYLGGRGGDKGVFEAGGKYANLKNKEIISSGQGGTVITDGMLDSPDDVSVSFDDQVKEQRIG